jgi:phosphate:Na+ symporter
MEPYSLFISWLSPDNIKLQIADSHILFNLINALILLLLIPYILKFVNLIVRGKDRYIERSGIDDRLLETPVIAVAQTQKEILKMALLARDNVELAFSSFYNDTLEFNDLIDQREVIINKYENDITHFLVKLSNSKVSKDEQEIITRFFNQVKDIERIGDFSETMASFIKEEVRKKLKLSEEAKGELMKMYKLVIESFNLCIDILGSKDVQKCKRVIEIEKAADNLEDQLRSSNIKRLNEGKCSAENSALFLDMVNNLERITDHSKNLAEAMLNS